MPVTIKTSTLRFKNESNQYIGVDAVAERTLAEQVAELEDAGSEVVSDANTAMETKAAQTIASIPDDYTTLSNSVTDLKNALPNNFNQHVRINPFVTGSGSMAGTTGKIRVNRSSATILEDGTAKIARDSTSSTKTYGIYAYIEESRDIKGHKIYMSVDTDLSGATHYSSMRIYASLSGTTVSGSRVDVSGSSTKIEAIITLSGNANQINFILDPGSTVSNGEYVIIKSMQWIDLTDMFGASYEPSLSDFIDVYEQSLPLEFRLAYSSAVDLRVDKSLLLKAIKKPILCVSTYRDRESSSDIDYYYAISYDGKSFYQIPRSKSFAGEGIVTTDVQPFEWNNGLLMLCTSYHMNTGANDNVPTYDFKATYTQDFNTYYSVNADLGFMDAAYASEPYVWAPQIFMFNGKYYIIASISTGATVNGDLYRDTMKSRYLRPYYVEVDISFDGTALSISKATGASLTQLNIRQNDASASIMDVSLMYSTDKEELYAVYKDRIYNIVNIAISDNDDIDGNFTDLYQYVGNNAYCEAGYLTKIDDIEYVYICDYSWNPITLRNKLYSYTTTKPIVYGWEEVGCVNPTHSFVDGTPSGMRNPYPIEISKELAIKLMAKYNIPAIVPNFVAREREALYKLDWITKVSDIIFNTFGKYTEIRTKEYIPKSATKIVGGETVNCDMCFLNNPMALVIDKSGETAIKTPRGNLTVTKSDNTENVYYITDGQGVKMTSELD